MPKLIKAKPEFEKGTISVSDPIFHTEADLSESIKEPIKQLSSQNYSLPLAQKSRTDNSTVFRIIYLIEKVPGGAVTYKEIESQLQEELYDKAMSRESSAYLKKLHQHHAFQNNLEETIPSDFQPFVLK